MLLAIGMVLLDGAVELSWDDRISNAGARTLLATIAGTMITATVVVFWIRGLLVSTRSGDFPNRVLSSYLDDPEQQWLMGATVGIFTFATVVQLAVPGASADPVPTLSIATTALGTVAALIAIIYSISSGADAMHEQRILRRIVDATLQTIERRYPDGRPSGEIPPDEPGTTQPSDTQPSNTPASNTPSSNTQCVVVRSTRLGWLRSVADERILGELPDGGVCRRTLAIGNFVSPGQRLCVLSVEHPEPDLAERVEAAFELGVTRAPDDDISFGLRNIVDIALAGMGDGADRTNAREAIEHLEAVLRPLVVREGPARAHRDDRGRWMIRSEHHDFMAYLDDALEDLHDAVTDVRTRRLLATTVENLVDAAETAGRHDRARAMRRYILDGTWSSSS